MGEPFSYTLLWRDARVEQHSVQVGTQYYRDSFCERLRRLQEQEKLPITMYEYQQGKRWLIDCHFQVDEV